MYTAIILAGGLGTRLAQTVPNLPKALAPIQGVPFLKILLEQLDKSELFSNVILALGYKATNIQQFLEKQKYSFTTSYSIEMEPLGTGGALIHALRQTSCETLLVLNGDSYFDLPLRDFLFFHQKRHADISIACREVSDTSRFGAIDVAPDSKKILSFKEKSPEPKPGLINAGLYWIERAQLNYEEGVYSLEKDFFPNFLKANIYAYQQEGNFIDIGTPSSYNEAQQILKPWINV